MIFDTQILILFKLESLPQSLSAGCPNFIVSQTPQANTINDFWSMIWSEKSRTVLCLHTTNEVGSLTYINIYIT